MLARRRTISAATRSEKGRVKTQFPIPAQHVRRVTPARLHASFSKKNHAILISGGRSGRLADAFFQPYAEEISLKKIEHVVSHLN